MFRSFLNQNNYLKNYFVHIICAYNLWLYGKMEKYVQVDEIGP